jgi:hypothetical protein
MKLKSFCTAKEIVTDWRNSPQNGRKIFPVNINKNIIVKDDELVGICDLVAII